MSIKMIGERIAMDRAKWFVRRYFADRCNGMPLQHGNLTTPRKDEFTLEVGGKGFFMITGEKYIDRFFAFQAELKSGGESFEYGFMNEKDSVSGIMWGEKQNG